MKLQFKHQPFQAEAAAAVCDVFQDQPLDSGLEAVSLEGREVGDVISGSLGLDAAFRNRSLSPALTGKRLLENLRAVQRRNGLPLSRELSGPGVNLTVEMETGTGKTYTYVKTMYELNRRYGWSKFIVVVPSVAIREGVYRALQDTQEHFAEEYGKKLRFFIYRSDRLTQVKSFAADSAIHVMIINMQAFNSSKNQRTIHKPQDSFQSRRPIDVIARTNPILIIDEPQSVEGKQTKESLKDFRPLFTLRYSATHREKYDMVYRLDAMDAYNRHLVKKIAVLGVTLTGTTGTDGYVYLEGLDLYPDRPPTARLGFEVRGAGRVRTAVRTVRRGDDLFQKSNGLDEYAQGYVVTEIDGRDSSITFLNGLKLFAGQISGGEERTALQRRVQIRETIRTHLRRERELYPRGIKVLSLFFVDEVGKYRQYGEDGGSRAGEYARMFEEEYESLTRELQREIGDEEYLEYLDGISAAQTHQGYFSIDRRKGTQGRFIEGKINKRTQTSDDADAYDLIMRDKARLLSLEEPVRFLFSHSALREGWDNPNVFQICTLKPQSESEIRSRQEIGRGLRLCVNQLGERMDESVLGPQVQELNKLTLITDLEFGRFAQALQAGLAESLAGRPRKVDLSLFLGRTLTGARGETAVVDEELARAIYEDLIASGYVHRGELTGRFYQDRDRGCVQVAQEAAAFVPAVVELLSSVYSERAMAPEDANRTMVTAQADRAKLEGPAFSGLWEQIRHKSFYTVDFDSRELVQRAVQALNTGLQASRVFVHLEYGEQTGQIRSREQLRRGEAFRRRRTGQEAEVRPALGQVRYDLVGRLVEATGLTRATVAAVLQGMAPQRFALFRQDPESFLAKAAQLMNETKADLVLEHIAYHKLEAVYDRDLFWKSALRGRLGENAMAVERGLCGYLIYDSQKERDFAQAMEESDKVELYVKLPKSFCISTPVGRYSPDWAIVLRGQAGERRYVVAETKGSRDPGQLRGVERAKIACAKAHFAAVSGGGVTYCVVSSFDDLLERIL